VLILLLSLALAEDSDVPIEDSPVVEEAPVFVQLDPTAAELQLAALSQASEATTQAMQAINMEGLMALIEANSPPEPETEPAPVADSSEDSGPMPDHGPFLVPVR
jgi:hypothetical protein